MFKLVVLPLFFFGIFATEDFSQSDKVFENYLKEIIQGDIDVTVLLSTANYFDDGSVKEINTIGFESREESRPHDINLSLLGDKKIQKIVSNAKDSGVIVSLNHINKNLDVDTNYDTETLSTIDTAAAKVVNHERGFDFGLTAEVVDTLYQTNTVATISLAEYRKNGSIKKNTTASFEPKKIMVTSSENMKARLIEEATTLLRKAFKINSRDRAPLIAELFDQKFRKYKWQVLIDPTVYKIKSDRMITISYGGHTYVILGKLK